MTQAAAIFMFVSWCGVLGLVGWCYTRVLQKQARTKSKG